MSLFLAIFDPSSSIGKSIFDCSLPSVIMKQKCGFYLFSLLLEFSFIDRISTKTFPQKGQALCENFKYGHLVCLLCLIHVGDNST